MTQKHTEYGKLRGFDEGWRDGVTGKASAPRWRPINALFYPGYADAYQIGYGEGHREGAKLYARERSAILQRRRNEARIKALQKVAPDPPKQPQRQTVVTEKKREASNLNQSGSRLLSNHGRRQGFDDGWRAGRQGEGPRLRPEFGAALLSPDGYVDAYKIAYEEGYKEGARLHDREQSLRLQRERQHQAAARERAEHEIER